MQKSQWLLGFLILLVILLLSIFCLGHAADRGKPYRDQTPPRAQTPTDAAEPPSASPDAASSGEKILIDAGHGGVDPGKVGVGGEKEKDINLQIAKKLQKSLTDAGYRATLTRAEDTGLYRQTDSNKKITDLNNRCKMAEETSPALFISIHQNSYSSATIRGAQVFYFSGSDKGKQAAELLQKSLITIADPDNTRSAKENDNYYLLKHCNCPAVIVECGFLSNPDEAAKLASDDYQSLLVSALTTGIREYCTLNASE